MSAWRSADPELDRDGTVPDLLHTEAGKTAAPGARVGAEVGARAIEA
jgi:hypothetical protein